MNSVACVLDHSGLGDRSARVMCNPVCGIIVKINKYLTVTYQQQTLYCI